MQLFDLVHRDKDYSAQRKRLKFFLVIFVAIFVWEWVPEVRRPDSSLPVLVRRATST